MFNIKTLLYHKKSIDSAAPEMPATTLKEISYIEETNRNTAANMMGFIIIHVIIYTMVYVSCVDAIA